MNKIYNIALMGGRGFVGQEIIALIDNHPYFELSQVFSKSNAGKTIPNYKKNKHLLFTELDQEMRNIDPDIDIFILALANDDSKNVVNFLNSNFNKSIIIDVSSDHRFNNDWTYRLPETSFDEGLPKKISNPGCYATAMQLMLAPIKKDINGHVSIMGFSGFSGAGSTPNDKNNRDRLKGNILAYNLVNHTHEKEVKKHCYEQLSFTPHVADFFRGILTTAHIQLDKPTTEDALLARYQEFYKNKPLIHIDGSVPLITDAVGKHIACLGGFCLDNSKQQLRLCCTLDNLLKGAATQVIQNLNHACQFNETLGIHYE